MGSLQSAVAHGAVSKSLADRVTDLLTAVRNDAASSREKSLAITKLEEARFWLTQVLPRE